MGYKLKPIGINLNNRSVATTIIVVDEHVDKSLPCRNRFKHLPFKPEFRCYLRLGTILDKKSVGKPVGSRDKTVESIFRTLYEFTLVSSGISGKLECQMIVVCHQISNEIVLSIWRQEIESLGKIVIERMLLLAEVNLQLFEFKILAWETIVASVVGTLLAYISLIMRSGIGRQDEPTL